MFLFKILKKKDFSFFKILKKQTNLYFWGILTDRYNAVDQTRHPNYYYPLPFKLYIDKKIPSKPQLFGPSSSNAISQAVCFTSRMDTLLLDLKSRFYNAPYKEQTVMRFVLLKMDCNIIWPEMKTSEMILDFDNEWMLRPALWKLAQ